MKPYSHRKLNMNQRIFNYRLSRARRVVENAFGICAARFRVLLKVVEIHPERMAKVVRAVCALHNFLITRKSIYASSTDFDREIITDESVEILPGAWRQTSDNTQHMEPVRNNNGRSAESAQSVREELNAYFIGDGEVEWQYRSAVGR